MLRERFYCYIQGGEYKGITEEGCRDKTLPIEEKDIIIPHKVVYGGENKKRHAGVAFLNPEPKGLSLCKMYKITPEQFVDVLRQENGLSYTPQIDFEEVIKKYQLKVFDGEYGNMLWLGYCEGIPIFTFTCAEIPKETKPSKKYVDTINSGFADMAVNQYLGNSSNLSEIYRAVQTAYNIKNEDEIRERIEDNKRYIGRCYKVGELYLKVFSEKSLNEYHVAAIGFNKSFPKYEGRRYNHEELIFIKHLFLGDIETFEQITNEEYEKEFQNILSELARF